ncbi:MAG: hypothetical protein R6V03_11090 [Kiritimatiellia bacterium]
MILDKLDKLKQREKIGLIIAVACVFWVFMDRLVIQTITGTFRELSMDIEKEENLFDYRKSALSRKGVAHARFLRISDRIEKAPSSAEAIDGLNMEIDMMARETGLRLDSTLPREPREMGWCEECLVEIGRFGAGMDQLLRFLYTVRTRPGLLTVQNLTLSPGGEGPESRKGSMLVTKLVRVPEGEKAGE